jgi:hypothetical protein
MIIRSLLSTSSGLETVLSTINSASHALHYILASAPARELRSRLQTLLLLLPTESSIQLSRRRAIASPSLSAAPSQSSPAALLTLSSLISEARFTLRLLGLISLWSWGSATVKSPPADYVLRTVAFLQIFANMVYQILENIAYLASKGIAGKRLVSRCGGVKKWYLWSTRAWLGYVILDFAKLGREYSLRKEQSREQKSIQQSAQGIVETAIDVARGKGGENEEARKQEVRKWKKSLFTNLAWTPLFLHWSVEQGIGVPDSWTGFLSLVAGTWNVHDSWTASASS